VLGWSWPKAQPSLLSSLGRRQQENKDLRGFCGGVSRLFWVGKVDRRTDEKRIQKKIGMQTKQHITHITHIINHHPIVSQDDDDDDAKEADDDSPGRVYGVPIANLDYSRLCTVRAFERFLDVVSNLCHLTQTNQQ
jgi:hypothetical protein